MAKKEKNQIEQKELLNELQDIADKYGLDISGELKQINEKFQNCSSASKTWKRVELARNSDRPRALDYIDMIFDDFIELHGDRFFGDDPALIGGIGFIEGIPVTVVGNQKGKNLRETIERNGGMANPEGYRKALRLIKQAEKFRRPIVSFIDTQGAYPGLGAEERGIGEAIAVNLRELSRVKTPVICFIIGEGGSGGALGIGVGDKIYMLENSIFSVISPEGCASILLRDSSRAKDAAVMLKITSREVLGLKMINGVIDEPEEGAHTDPQKTAEAMRSQILHDITDLCKRDPSVLVKYRKKKIHAVGCFSE
ncbi:acetyl-CoA carboxylase carboxyltransferase subunit alpha [Treponema pedis]|uniref:Acetyl-coenzyme A carboxylase carboxyl transferase subunit alpha n=2 Tax=Treponema pedis TaxID=409322 RepID=S6A148_9SPIR|nr:acetyl-CoA carboxylase carboxyltransferase subunit alpha [Treponema pedis]AGT44498.1 acetyl-CoA carboxylase, carboxyl transferase subunit alpha [Treponema pedis str. T A4]QOW59813.1 acetyl-CoA carboxylase carboxyltransferase subunit alpha [Treponema pedis]QSI05178.1 acetyl-CoA carboxylase carboxyltransferase subunit alpha [Treponema pedis]